MVPQGRRPQVVRNSKGRVDVLSRSTPRVYQPGAHNRERQRLFDLHGDDLQQTRRVRRRRRPSLLMYATGRPLLGGSKKAKRILIHRCPSSDHRTAAIVWQTFDDIHRPWRKEPPIKWFDGTHNAAGLSLTVFFLSRPMKNENRRRQTNSPPQPEILLLAFI